MKKLLTLLLTFGLVFTLVSGLASCDSLDSLLGQESTKPDNGDSDVIEDKDTENNVGDGTEDDDTAEDETENGNKNDNNTENGENGDDETGGNSDNGNGETGDNNDEGDDVCSHEKIAIHIQDPHHFDSNGNLVNDKILNVCEDCNAAWISYDYIMHKYVDNLKVVPPTCYDDGYTITKSCSICGIDGEKTDIMPATGHDWSEWIGLSGSACIGGMAERYCKSNCGVESEIKMIPQAPDTGIDGIHTVDCWTTVREPTADTLGEITGTCSSCGTTVSVAIGKLPQKISNAEYQFTIITPRTSCTDTGEYEYTHKASGLKFRVIEQGASAHSLNGQILIDYHDVTPGTEFESAYYYEDHPGIIQFANHPLTCDEASLAHFYCDAVNDHGMECSADIVIYAKKRHDFEYKEAANLLYTDATGSQLLDYSNPDNAGNCAYRYGECPDCGYSEYSKVETYKSEIEQPSCQAPGHFTVSYTGYGSPAGGFKEEVIYPQLKHKLNGTDLSLHTDSNPKVYTLEELEAAGAILIEPDSTDDYLDFDIYAVKCDCTCGCPPHLVYIRVAKQEQ